MHPQKQKSWLCLTVLFLQQIDAEDICKINSTELQEQTLKDLLNLKEDGEITITIFIRMVGSLSVLEWACA